MNTNHIVLRQLVEQVSGTSFGEFGNVLLSEESRAARLDAAPPDDILAALEATIMSLTGGG